MRTLGLLPSASACEQLKSDLRVLAPRPFIRTLAWSTNGRSSFQARLCTAQWNTYKPDEVKRTQLNTDVGLVAISPLQAEDERGTAILITRSLNSGQKFAEMRDYVRKSLKSPPDGLMMVARLTPEDASELQLGQSSLVVGLARLSFNPATREKFPTLQPPDQAAYLTNIAVEPRFRRKGIASALLTVCEEIVQDAQLNSIYLHAWQADPGAQAFYSGAGYKVAGKDSGLAAVWHRLTPRVLYYKDLPTS